MTVDSHNYKPHSLSEIFAAKYGDCKDQTLLAIAMLAEIGVKGYPVLYCGEQEMSPKGNLPMPLYFNHAIVGIEHDGAMHYTDVLQKGYYFDEVNPVIEGGKVFVINEKGGFFDQVPQSDVMLNADVMNKTIDLRDDGSAVVEVNAVWSRDMSTETREALDHMTDEQKKDMYAMLDEKYTRGQGTVVERRWKNRDTPYSNVHSYIKYDRPEWATVMGDLIVVEWPRFYFPVELNTPRRIYPIVFWNESVYTLTTELRIPENHEILYVPENVSLNTDFAVYKRQHTVEGRTIYFEEQLRYKKCRLEAERYKEIKDFFNTFERATQQKIILQKAGGGVVFGA